VSSDRRTVAVGLIVFGIILVAFAILYPFDSGGENDGAIPLPEAVGGLPLLATATGRQAVDEIAGLHGMDFALTDGARGIYGHNGEVTLWVSASTSESTASQLLIAMRDKIAEGNSPFETIGEKNVDGRTVYQLEGLGQMHYYFQSGNLLIWLAADHDLAGQALEQALAFYR
jgi:hypothetical protein